MFKNLSLKNKLAISASIAIILGGVLVEALSYNAALKRLDIEVEQRLQSTTTSYNQYVNDWLISKERALTALSNESKQEDIVTHLNKFVTLQVLTTFSWHILMALRKMPTM